MKTDTTLKNSEMERTLRVRLENINYELVKEKEANEKKLKALEIIKEKNVEVGRLKRLFNDEVVIRLAKIYKGNYFLYLYNSCCGELYGRLTEEEINLLKEVLL